MAGCILVFFAAILFYLSTAVIRISTEYVDLDPAFFVFVRFIFGYLIVCFSLIIKWKALRPQRYSLLIGRALANSMAVYCFYKAVAGTSLAEANILNMTYPVFVALFSWILLKNQRDIVSTMGTLIAFAGIYLVLVRGPVHLLWDHIWGLVSGISGACAILFLNVSRKYHDTETILFYLFGIGSIFTYVLFHDAIHWPERMEVIFLLLCGAFAIAGQYCITFGYRYITAVEGGIIASSRIVLAAVLGPYIVGDPRLHSAGWLGAGLIFIVNILLAIRKTKSIRLAATPAANQVTYCLLQTRGSKS